jgi:hypothetical protein
MFSTSSSCPYGSLVPKRSPCPSPVDAFCVCIWNMEWGGVLPPPLPMDPRVLSHHPLSPTAQWVSFRPPLHHQLLESLFHLSTVALWRWSPGPPVSRSHLTLTFWQHVLLPPLLKFPYSQMSDHWWPLIHWLPFSTHGPSWLPLPCDQVSFHGLRW